MLASVASYDLDETWVNFLEVELLQLDGTLNEIRRFKDKFWDDQS